MLADVGCRYVIVGHSERRALYGESDELVARKFAAVGRHALVPILCVGESLDDRERDATRAVILRQLDAVLGTAGAGSFARAVVAYEPVWAIGTGRTAYTDAGAGSARVDQGPNCGKRCYNRRFPSGPVRGQRQGSQCR